MEPLHCTKGSL